MPARGRTHPISAVRRIPTGRSRTPARGVTWQLTPRNKVGGFWDAQALCRSCTGATPGLAEPQRISPEAVGVLGRPLHVTQATWSSPVDGRCSSRRASAARTSASATSSANQIRRAISFASSNSARAAVRRMAAFPGWSTARRISARRTPGRTCGGVRVLRDRHAQPEGRLSAHVDDRRPDVDDEQSEPDVPRRQRRAEPADAVDLAHG